MDRVLFGVDGLVTPLLGQFWDINFYRPEDLRSGPFSICHLRRIEAAWLNLTAQNLRLVLIFIKLDSAKSKN